MLKTTMAYNWTAANTPQGRERLFKILKDCGHVALQRVDLHLFDFVRRSETSHGMQMFCGLIDSEDNIHAYEIDEYIAAHGSNLLFLDPSPEPNSADTKDLMDLGKSIAKTQELLMGMNEPRPSNDLLWEAWWASAKNWGAEHVLESEVRPRFQEWIASIEVDPYEDQDEDLQSPAWCIDCSKMIPFLEDSFALLGFHPTLGHCVIASNYGFTQVRDGRFSVVSYASEPREFMDSKSAADWCAAEKVWFIPPHGNDLPTTQADPLAADRQVVFDAWDNGYLGISGEDHVAQPILKSLKRLMGVEVNHG
jgi:hypothetical protein